MAAATSFDISVDGGDASSTVANITASIAPAESTASGVTSFSAGTTGLTPSTATSGAVTLSGTLAIANGGTGSSTASFSGANITSLNASNISTGTVATARLGTGTANSTTYLRGDQTWASIASGGGKVLQVISAFSTTATSTTAGPTDATGLSVTITPSSTSSKVLVMVTVNGDGYNSGNGIILDRSGTTIANGTAGTRTNYMAMSTAWGTSYTAYTIGLTYLDSPATTASRTYKIRFYSDLGNTVYINRTTGGDVGFSSSITVLEIGP